MSGKSAILAVKIISDARGAVTGLDQTSNSVGKLAGLAGGAAAAGAAALGGALIAAGGKAIQMGANLEQSQGAIETVFKGGAGQMLAWSDSAATAVGLTKNEFNELGTLIGTQLKNGGTAMSDLGPKTNELIGLGADLSSMFGGSTKDAVEALSSALKGERDPIERYGVSLTQSAIDAEAARLGYSKVGGALSAQATQAATLSLIMKQTSDAHGNFARESDTVSHKQQVLSAQFQNTAAQVGTALLPAVNAFLGLLITLGIVAGPLGAQLIAGITQISTGFASFVGQVGPGLKVFSEGFTGAFTDLATDAPPVVAAFFNLGMALNPLYTLFTQNTGASTGLSSVFAGFGPVLGAMGVGLLGLLPQLATLAATIAGGVQPILAGFVGIIQGVVIPAVLALAAGFVMYVLPGINQMMSAFNGLLAFIVPVIAQISLAIMGTIQRWQPEISAAMTAITQIFGGAFQIIGSIVSIFTGAASALWRTFGADIISVGQGALSIIIGVFSGGFQILAGIVRTVSALLKGDWSGAMEGLKQIGSGAMTVLKGIFSGGFDIINGLFHGFPGRIVSALGNLSGLLRGAGESIMRGFQEGILKKWQEIQDKVSGMGQWIQDHKGPITYDRKLLIGAGVAIMAGLRQGLASGMPALGSQLAQITGAIASLDAAPTIDLRTHGTEASGTAGGAVQITVNGALDPDAVARQIRDLLNRDGILRGSVPVNGTVIA